MELPQLPRLAEGDSSYLRSLRQPLCKVES